MLCETHCLLATVYPDANLRVKMHWKCRTSDVHTEHCTIQL